MAEYLPLVQLSKKCKNNNYNKQIEMMNISKWSGMPNNISRAIHS